MHRNYFCRQWLIAITTVLCTFFYELQCADFLYSQFTPMNMVTSQNSTWCFSHRQCSLGTFCAPVGLLDGFYSKWLTYGECRPCTSCLCDSDAIDKRCPHESCPAGEIGGIRFLEGGFYNGLELPNGDVCVTIFVFEGHTFRQMSFSVAGSLYTTTTGEKADGLVLNEKSQCTAVHAGLKSGVFEIDSGNRLRLIYSSGYDFHPSSISFTGLVKNDCPNILLILDRSSIPVFVQADPSWTPPPGAMSAYERVQPPSHVCGDQQGFCLTASNIESRSQAQLRLHRMSPDANQGEPLRARWGSLAKGAWRADVASEFLFAANGSMCTLVMEQSALAKRVVYFRSHVYGCTPPKRARNHSRTSARRAVQTSTAAVVAPKPTTRTIGTTRVPRLSTSSTTVTWLNLTNLTTASIRHQSTTATPACRGHGDLDVSSGGTFENAYLLNCPSGSVNVLNYAPNLKKFWIIDFTGPIAIWFSTVLGIGTSGDYINITSSSLPASFISGADSDPTVDVKLKKCLIRPACTQEAEIFTKDSFNQTFDGPLMVNFVSQANSGGAGAVLEYYVLSSLGVRRLQRANARRLANFLGASGQSHALSKKIQGSAMGVLRDVNVSGDTAAEATHTLCKCSAVPNSSCPSLFFQDPVCVPALATWPWLGYHSESPLNFGNFSRGVDAIVYFERFQNFNANKNLYVTASFDIYTPTLPHSLDVVSLFKGEDDDTGVCDLYRSFGSCTRKSPLSTPPTLQRQLCWAYTSALKNPWGDPHVPDLKYQAFGGSVDFCGGVAESAGPGVYYLVLFSYRVQGIIAQVDYIQSRDCLGISFPCTPTFSANNNRQYDQSGPLAVCPAMNFRNSDLACAPCAPGSFSNLPNSQTCFSCPAGKFLPRLNLNIDNCTLCPIGNLTGFSASVVFQCSINKTTTNNTGNSNNSKITSSMILMTTAVAKYCGDGIVTELVNGKGEQCDAGSQLPYSSLSPSVSIYDLADSTAKVRSLMKENYLMCERKACQLMPYWCGDGIITSYGPIYIKAACKTLAGKLICDEGARLKTEGNITVYYNEQCDDGNIINGDGCSSMCIIEKNFRCTVSFGRYFCYTTCGNGLLDADTGESCDDGNSFDGDGCNKNCKIECGFSCINQDASHLSSCATVCGDGIIAGKEECDPESVASTFQNPHSDGCNAFCRQQVGWSCTVATSGCSSNFTRTQMCLPICGDGLTFFPEECDDSDWNFDDKACKSDCKMNRQDVCYGPSCMSPGPTLDTSFAASELISSMQTNNQGMSEGIFIFQDSFSSLSVGISRAFVVFPQQYANISRMYPAMFLAAGNNSQLLESAQSLSSPFCLKPPNSVWSSESGRISESWSLLANNISCKYDIFPRPVGQNLKFVIIKLLFLKIELNQDSLIQIESTQATFSQGKTRCTIKAPFISSNLSGPMYLLSPVTIVLSASGQKQTENYDFSKIMELDSHYTTLSASEATTENVLCLSRCQCDFSCGQLCFSANSRRLQNQFSITSRQNVAIAQSFQENWNLASTQVLAINSQPSIFSGQAPVVFPSDFSQNPENLLISIMTNETSSVLKISEGSWRGTCHYQYETLLPAVTCNVLVHISNDTVIKHVWNCPLKGHSVGRIITFDEASSSVVDSSFEQTFYRKAKIIWTRGGSGDSTDVTTRCVFSTGNTDVSLSGNTIQMLLEGATKTDLGIPRFLDGGLFTPEGNCRVLSLAPYTESTALSSSLPLFQAEDVDRYLACNMSISEAIEKLQSHSSDCFILVRALLMRDFWAPLNLNLLVLNSTLEYDPLSRFVCTSACRDRFVEEIQNSVNVCGAGWNRGWSEWGFGIRIFKLLISGASALYWSTLLCATNHHAKTCAEVSMRAANILRATNCSLLLNQPVFTPRFVANKNPCSKYCSAALLEYINNLGCCATTIDDASNVWLQTLTNPSISAIRFDFGDRSNPFNTSFPTHPEDLVDITFSSDSGFGILPTGIENVRNIDKVTTLYSLLDSTCRLCNLPYQNRACCDALNCVNGTKLYSGSCSCLCSEGFQGTDCGFQDFFAEARVSFQVSQIGFPGNIISYCEEANFYRAASYIFDVDLEEIDFQPLVISGRRSEDPTAVLSVFRIRAYSCSDAARTTQKISSMSDQSVISLFMSSGLPKPVVKSIWTYCNGRKTTCGANAGALTGSVSQEMVFLACTSSNSGNETVDNSYANLVGGSGSSAPWKVAVIAVSTVFAFCSFCIISIYFRRKIYRKVRVAYRHMKSNRKRDILFCFGKPQNSRPEPMADMVFVQDSEQKEPTQFLILSPFQPQVFELDFLDEYIASDKSEAEKECISTVKGSVQSADHDMESRQNPTLGRPVFVPPLNLGLLGNPSTDNLNSGRSVGKDTLIESGSVSRLDSGRSVPRFESDRSHRLDSHRQLNTDTCRRLDSNMSLSALGSARRLDSDRSHRLDPGSRLDSDRRLDSNRSFGVVGSTCRSESNTNVYSQKQVGCDVTSKILTRMESPRSETFEDNVGRLSNRSVVRSAAYVEDEDPVYSSQVTTPRWSAFT